MCHRVFCRKCNKPSWAGCGAHVEAVLGDVPKDDRCKCIEEPNNSTGSFLGWLFGKKKT